MINTNNDSNDIGMKSLLQYHDQYWSTIIVSYSAYYAYMSHVVVQK